MFLRFERQSPSLLHWSCWKKSSHGKTPVPNPRQRNRSKYLSQAKQYWDLQISNKDWCFMASSWTTSEETTVVKRPSGAKCGGTVWNAAAGYNKAACKELMFNAFEEYPSRGFFPPTGLYNVNIKCALICWIGSVPTSATSCCRRSVWLRVQRFTRSNVSPTQLSESQLQKKHHLWEIIARSSFASTPSWHISSTLTFWPFTGAVPALCQMRCLPCGVKHSTQTSAPPCAAQRRCQRNQRARNTDTRNDVTRPPAPPIWMRIQCVKKPQCVEYFGMQRILRMNFYYFSPCAPSCCEPQRKRKNSDAFLSSHPSVSS